MKIEDKILRRVRRAAGQVFSPRDFLDLGARTGVDKALSRLVRAGALRRVARGLYDAPRQSALVAGDLPPSLESVVDALARRFDVVIVPHHAAAANAMGLTTAVPVRPAFVASRAIGDIKLQGRTIPVRAAPRALAPWLATPAAPLVQSIIWLREGAFPLDDAATVRKLKTAASPSAKAALARGIGKLPAWAQPLAREIAAASGA